MILGLGAPTYSVLHTRLLLTYYYILVLWTTVETIPVNPNQVFPTHLAAYPNPVAEKQKVEEYIKLIRHEQFEESLSIPSLNFDQIEEWVNPTPQHTGKPPFVVTSTDTPVP